MSLSPLAGKVVPKNLLLDSVSLEREYFERKPDLSVLEQRVIFGTSGHRGSPFHGTFTEAHILAITQAICEYRRTRGIEGPLFIGKDTHALSRPAERTALEVLAANGVQAILQKDDEVTPTPVISRAILVQNRNRKEGVSDGIVITPSHNPPEDGGFKYNLPNGGPADGDATNCIQDRANELLHDGNRTVKRIPFERAIRAATTHQTDFLIDYVNDLSQVIDTEVIRGADLKLGVDPLGGASKRYWEAIASTYDLNIEVVNPALDPTFSFMRVDHDGKIRMDCSSPYAMKGLLQHKDHYHIAFANDPDCDRFGIITPSMGLLNPNWFLTVAIHYLLTHRVKWKATTAVGKTVVTTGLIDRVARHFNRKLVEMPVGFKWFAPGLLESSLCFAGEESAGASFLRRDGSVWTTDKDGLIMNLLSAEVTARTGKDPGKYYQELTKVFGRPYYTRMDSPASPEEKLRLQRLSNDSVKEDSLAGEPILTRLTRAPENQAPIGGLKIVTRNGWFAARPSGTENVYKIYAESFKSQDHLDAIVRDAQRIIRSARSAFL